MGQTPQAVEYRMMSVLLLCGLIWQGKLLQPQKVICLRGACRWIICCWLERQKGGLAELQKSRLSLRKVLSRSQAHSSRSPLANGKAESDHTVCRERKTLCRRVFFFSCRRVWFASMRLWALLIWKKIKSNFIRLVNKSPYAHVRKFYRYFYIAKYFNIY
jgi:hypothetical protein